MSEKYTGLEIAVIGMSGRFPGANSVDQFWDNLKEGVESIRFYSREELLENGEEEVALDNPNYVMANSHLNDKDFFDSNFFGIRPDEATLMDPQMRIMHEVLWEALEDAAIDLDSNEKGIGLFLGGSNNVNWQVCSTLLNSEGKVDDYTAKQLASINLISAKLAYLFNLKGPAIYADTACSTSLVNIHQACRSLLMSDCEVALAGGVAMSGDSKRGYFYQEGTISSVDGHCRTFDENASGTITGEGAGVVVLKKLKEAIEDRDNIHAIIRGTAINNDGHDKVSFTAPSVDGQAEVILKAQSWAGVKPNSIGYVEAHGTATVLGDPIEVEALNLVFGKSDKRYCALGSVKSNIGHLDAAAGVTGFIKTVLSLKNKQLVPSLNYYEPNPKIRFEESAFFVNTTLQNWERNGHPLRAGVSAFGVGGTNAHAILEEAPKQEPTSSGRVVQLLNVSAKTPGALQRNLANLGSFLEQNRTISLSEVAYTLKVGRTAFPYRQTIVCEGIEDAIQQLSSVRISGKAKSLSDKKKNKVVFMFPGQGSQYINMGAQLYASESAFQSAADECFNLILKHTEKDLKSEIFANEASKINETEYTQPALFVIEYALAKLIMSWGIRPDVMIGHSIGEYVAACLSGVFSLPEALRLVLKRGELMQRMPKGRMLSVSIKEEELCTLLEGHPEVSLATVNSSSSCVVAGPVAAVEAFDHFLQSASYLTKRIHTSHAFHSQMMEGMLEEFEKEFQHIRISPYQIPFIANLTGKQATNEELITPSYWVNQLRKTIKFSHGISSLMAQENLLFVEVGPGKTLGTFVGANQMKGESHKVITLLGKANDQGDDLVNVLRGLGKLWTNGVQPDWRSFYQNEQRQKVSIPTYSFDKFKYPVYLDAFKMLNGNVSLPDLTIDRGIANEYSLEDGLSNTEKEIAKLWQNFFGKSDIQIEDDFFEIGGDSLQALTLLQQINKHFSIEISLGDFLAHSTVQSLSALVEKSENSSQVEIQKVADKPYYAASTAQQRLYFLNQLDKRSLAYNLPQIITLDKEVSRDQLEDVINQLINRHETLRTEFEVQEGEIVQKIHSNIKIELEFLSCDEDQFNATYQQFIKPFDLEKAPLLRCAYIQIDATDISYLLMDIHHIIADGLSFNILKKEFNSLLKGEELSPLSLQYRDYAEWEKQFRLTEKFLNQKSYWENYYQSPIEPLKLPLDFARPARQSFRGVAIHFTVDRNTTELIEQLIKEHGVTMNSFLISVYGILLSQFCNQKSIIVGSTVAGRQHSDLQAIVGVFNNFLSIRLDIDDGFVFTEFLKATHHHLIEVYNNQDYPVEELIQNLQLPTDLSRNPLYDTVLNYHNESDLHSDDPNESNFELEEEGIIESDSLLEASTLDLKVDIVKQGGQLKGAIQYDTALFKKETNLWLVAKLMESVKYFAINPNTKIGSHAIFTTTEIDALSAKRSNFKGKADELQLSTHSSFVAQPMDQSVKWWCQKFGYHLEITHGSYNNVIQDLLDPSSALSESEEVRVLLLKYDDCVRDLDINDPARTQLIQDNFQSYVNAIRGHKNHAPLLVGLFSTAAYQPADEVLVSSLNEQLKKELATVKYVSLIDLESFERLYGVAEVRDEVSDDAGHVPFTDDYFQFLGTIIARKVCALRNLPFKVIALDCDHTLWSGICGEGPVKVGSDHKFLQQFMLDRYNEGFLLALSSKNNEEDVWKVFEEHPEMILKKHHFINWRINWESKSENLKAMSQELNVGVDSFIFIDDSPAECEEVMLNCPEVLTLHIPDETSQFDDFFGRIWAFDRPLTTQEDQTRNLLYQQEQQRNESKSASANLETYISGLKLEVFFNELSEAHIPRVAQLTQRTNQFNLSTIRRSEAEIRNLHQKAGWTCWEVFVRDKFGDYGLTGVVITYLEAGKLIIDTLLLSCRVLGRTVEEVLMIGLKKYCIENNLLTMEADFVPSGKNVPLLEFMNKSWRQVSKSKGIVKFSLTTNDIPDTPAYAELSYKKVVPEIWSSGEKLEQQHLSKAINGSHNRKDLNWHLPRSNKENLLHEVQYLPLEYKNMEEIGHWINGHKVVERFTEINGQKPENDIEKQLAKVWAKLLSLDETTIGLHDDFFKIGGNSLKAISVISQMSKRLQVEVTLDDIFNFSTIRTLSNRLAQLSHSEYEPLQIAPQKDYYSLSSAQRQMYFIKELDQDSLAYNLPQVVTLEGPLDKAKLENVFRRLIKRHESLRTSFEMRGEEVVQRIEEEVDFSIEYFESDEDQVQEIVSSLICPFDLEKDLLIRVGLIQLRPEAHVLVVDMHHIITDGASQAILIKDFMALYNDQELPEVGLQYKDYSEWQQAEQQQERLSKQGAFWKKEFEKEVEILNLPTDFSRPKVKGHKGDSLDFSLSTDETQSLKAIAEQEQATMFMAVLSVFNVLLSKLSNQEDIVVGIPVAGRDHVDLEDIMGMFVNTLALRNYPQDHLGFADFLGQVRTKTLACFANQMYPYEMLIDELKIARDSSHNPLFDVRFVYQNFELEELVIPDLKLKPFNREHQVAKFDLMLTVLEAGDQVHFNLEYSTELFKKETVERFVDYFKRIVREVIKDVHVVISKIDILSRDERNQLLFDINDKPKTDFNEQSLIERFETQVKKFPNKIAVVFEDELLTYQKLDTCSNVLAAQLNEIDPQTKLVALYMKPSLEMIISILAVWKSGMAFLPLDKDHSSSRHQDILDQSKCDILLTDDKLSSKVSFSGKVITIDHKSLLFQPWKPFETRRKSDLAYVIYTSGSTGMPKGVAITERNVVNYVNWLRDFIELTPDDKSILTSSYAFDLGYTSLFPVLLTGGELHLVSSDLYRSPDDLAEYIHHHAITYLKMTPSLFSTFSVNHHFATDKMTSLKYVLLGGEPIKTEMIEQVYRANSSIHFINHYGPTETTIGAIAQYIERENLEEFVNQPSIGRPIHNTRCYIVGKSLDLLPHGNVGELCIAGEGVGAGYYQEASLTSANFVDDPFSKRGKMYKTGDFARWLPNGNIEFLGRADDQLKIRGFRVELGEITRQLLNHEAVEEAIVIPVEEEDTYLIAYYVLNQKVEVAELRNHLSDRLPDYMMPSSFMRIEQMPLNKNGKIDRDALPDPIPVEEKPIEGPSSEIETKLVEIWSEILNLDKDKIGVTQNFFEIGGHSLRAISMLNKVKKAYNVKVQLTSFFKAPTIKDLNKTILLSRLMVVKS